MKEKQGTTTNKRRYWKEIQENITTFQNVEEIQLRSCCNLHINLVANKLKNIDMNNCVESQISVKTESIERMKLEDNKLTQFKLTTNKSSDICIEKCENFKIEIEANNEQNVDIIEGNNIEFKTKCPINKLTIIESKEVSIKGNEKCKSLKVVDLQSMKMMLNQRELSLNQLKNILKYH
ncbi:DNA double-strand break repair Rad50 ATPase, putative [Entamoeba histolytica HM-3:IMSS]|uniref:DNA double-strand break repair Rad50 ATPase, putative n=1 Tax=Entamoeba histolytica HM-3:IMSS TaxID=885315 RepID=M7WAD0_ENTHI|nr:DNA double-strand break repair Rad50 ATPase, putative [Entamoeba histolytica HM-3:IMSS]